MASSPSCANPKWMSFFSDTGGGLLLDAQLEAEEPQNFFWCNSQNNAEQADCSVGNEGKEETTEENGIEKDLSVSRKRSRDDSSKDNSGSKANREKMRRDRLNDRFIELGQALEPGKVPKTDKASILADAVRVLSQLREEAALLKEGNEQLREQIKELKDEKNELRDEKARLKTEKEKLESHMKSMTFPSGFLPHPAAMQAVFASQNAAANFQAPNFGPLNTNFCPTTPGMIPQMQNFGLMAQSTQNFGAQSTNLGSKISNSGPRFPEIAMWQWMPPSAVDTSQDHVWHPPVA